MHEMAIAQSILDIAVTHAERHQAKKINTITLQIGELTGVEPEALVFCFSALAAETLATGAELQIQMIPLVIHCPSCRQDFPVEHYRFVCPVCGSLDITILSGRELKVEHLEVD